MTTKVYYDTEFIEDGETIDLISIGMVRLHFIGYKPTDEGREIPVFHFEEYYAVNSKCDWDAAIQHPFVSQNVVPHLPVIQEKNFIGTWRTLDRTDVRVKPKWVIANEVREFLIGNGSGGEIRAVDLVADYGAYDHVALCQLWGTMMDLPEGVPMWTNDFRTKLSGSTLTDETLGNYIENTFDLSTLGPEHQALTDAKVLAVKDWFLDRFIGEEIRANSGFRQRIAGEYYSGGLVPCNVMPAGMTPADISTPVRMGAEDNPSDQREEKESRGDFTDEETTCS